MKPKKTLSSSGNAVIRDAFLVLCFFFLSLTHAPIFHRSMRMQRNIWCIAAATFKMIAMSSARSTSVLSVVKTNRTNKPRPDLRHIPPLESFAPPKLAGDSTDYWVTPISVRISVSVILGIKCEWPSNLLIYKCGDKTEDMKTAWRDCTASSPCKSVYYAEGDKFACLCLPFDAEVRRFLLVRGASARCSSKLHHGAAAPLCLTLNAPKKVFHLESRCRCSKTQAYTAMPSS